MVGSSDVFNRADVVVRDGHVVKNRFNSNVVVDGSVTRKTYQRLRHDGSHMEGLVTVPDYWLDTIQDGRVIASLLLSWWSLEGIKEGTDRNDNPLTIITLSTFRAERP